MLYAHAPSRDVPSHIAIAKICLDPLEPHMQRNQRSTAWSVSSSSNSWIATPLYSSPEKMFLQFEHRCDGHLGCHVKIISMHLYNYSSFSSSNSANPCHPMDTAKYSFLPPSLVNRISSNLLLGPPGSNWCFSFAPELVGYSAPRDLHRRAAYSVCESWFSIHQDVYHDLFVCS